MTLLHTAILLMMGALVFYSLGVWWEQFAGRLRAAHALCFWLGFTCDTVGTDLMRRMVGGLALNMHSLTGATALALMAIHAIWAVVVLRRHDDRAAVTFHRFSVAVWVVWLVPFISGVAIASLPSAQDTSAVRPILASYRSPCDQTRRPESSIMRIAIAKPRNPIAPRQ